MHSNVIYGVKEIWLSIIVISDIYLPILVPKKGFYWMHIEASASLKW